MGWHWQTYHSKHKWDPPPGGPRPPQPPSLTSAMAERAVASLPFLPQISLSPSSSIQINEGRFSIDRERRRWPRKKQRRGIWGSTWTFTCLQFVLVELECRECFGSPESQCFEAFLSQELQPEFA